MIKKFFLLVVCISLTYFASAQSDKLSNFELGVRIGSWGGGGASVDGVFNLQKNRIHGDLGFFQNAFTIEAYYDWSFPIVDNLSFYPGPGAGMAFTSDGFVLGIGGELGFEYAFKFPLTIGIDWRPMIMLFNSSGFGYGNGGLNIRYRF